MDDDSGTVTVERSDAATTYPLWRDVLRDGRPVDRPADPPGTLHLAARTPDGRVVGVVRFVPAPCPYRPGALAPWQLRGMATDPSVRGSGVGRALVTEGLARVAALGGDLVWCDARTTAVGFYERLGFSVVSGPFDKPDVGPSVGMLTAVGPRAAGASRSS
ncbi:GNAT family N-acetyltransferase [Blastococcus saxobsidens]|uniref:Acetyltransferase (GNAT) family protein n=1 Tax=Blastococcus saxobsidens TaxID=138336 RepID=A0A4Q7YB85_9ACTN|nr:GNAT family N-acetyltransferase [Blastococcus saxobsidens]RZU34477.1 acetyltransferase (GNAT) family protein [Blastococcus saxobsidens]